MEEVPRPLIPPFMLERDRTNYERWFSGLPRLREPSDVSRNKLLTAAGGYCGICGLVIRDINHANVDHVVPKARGGANQGNRVLAHKLCNTRKADRMPTACERIWLDVVNTGLKI